MTSPLKTDLRYLAWCGLETDLIFNRGIDLPEFASFPLLEKPETRAMLLDYAIAQIDLVRARGLGIILESVTWIANRDRAAPLGYTSDELVTVNRDAVAILVEARAVRPGAEVLISVNVGPRGDGYTGGGEMSADEAEDYHAHQIGAVAGTKTDIISGYTLTDANEAIGIARAARALDMPSVISFTVETDGRLPNGQTLDHAISHCDAATSASPLYYMVNCAHPDHFSETLTGNPRLQGAVVNASRCSHAELDEAEKLDDGDPEETGRDLAALAGRYPSLRVFGGCCGTDLRHLGEMAKRISPK